MKMFKAAIEIAIVALAGVTAAVSIPKQAARQTATMSLELCSGASWTGKCTTFASPHYTWDTCYTLTKQFPAGTSNGVDSSKTGDGTYCILYPNTDCTGGNPNTGGELWVGLYEDMSDSDVGFGDAAQSFQCRTYDWSEWDGYDWGN